MLINFAALNYKSIVMKKLFAICAIAISMVACNNEATTTDATADSLKAVATADSLKAAAAADSIKAATDTAAKKVDSLTKAAVDSLKK